MISYLHGARSADLIGARFLLQLGQQTRQASAPFGDNATPFLAFSPAHPSLDDT